MEEKRKKGFTLLEVAVSVLVISFLLAGITIAIENNAKRDRDNVAKNDIRKIAMALELKYNQNLAYPNLPDPHLPREEQKILPGDERLYPFLIPTPFSNGVREYFWFDDGSERPQKFCVFFQLESNSSQYFSCTKSGCKSSEIICPDF